jgi:hypothetical protein
MLLIKKRFFSTFKESTLLYYLNLKTRVYQMFPFGLDCILIGSLIVINYLSHHNRSVVVAPSYANQ